VAVSWSGTVDNGPPTASIDPGRILAVSHDRRRVASLEPEGTITLANADGTAVLRTGKDVRVNPTHTSELSGER
jgi:hypothetical protein